MSILDFFEGAEIKRKVEYSKDDFSNYDYQPVVDTIMRMGNQFNERSDRFIKGRIITDAIQRATNGRLKFINKVGYDSVDESTKVKYEIRSLHDMFTDHWRLKNPLNLKNTLGNPKIEKTFDFLWAVQTDPRNFAIAEFDWQTCYDNHYYEGGQFKMKSDVDVVKWISRRNTRMKNIEQITLDIDKFLEPLYG